MAAFRGQPDEVSGAVEVRMARQRLLDSGERRFAVVVEEAALYFRIGSVDMMASAVTCSRAGTSCRVQYLGVQCGLP